VDQRNLDQLVKAITRELATEQSRPLDERLGETAAAASPGRGGFYLIDNWRVRADDRDTFLSFYTRHVAEVIKQLPGYVDGRVLVAPLASPYSWHVEAMYEFTSDAILDSFHREFDRQVKRVDPKLSLDKVLDAMDRWVLAHEDGTLNEVWR